MEEILGFEIIQTGISIDDYNDGLDRTTNCDKDYSCSSSGVSCGSGYWHVSDK